MSAHFLHLLRHVSPVPPRAFACLCALVLCLVVPRVGHAHELDIDRLRFRVEVREAVVVAELAFDPELTRAPKEPVSPTVAEERVLAFLRSELTVFVDGKPCPLAIAIRELDDGSGAVPGDLVDLRCVVTTTKSTFLLRTQLGGRFRPLSVEIPELGSKGTIEIQSELVSPGTSSRDYRVQLPSSSAPASNEAPPQVLTFSEFRRYLVLGFTHVLPLGLDHLLFIVGIALGTRNFRDALIALSGFTLAHSLTLALCALGLVSVSPSIVEPVIALSIGLVGLENLFSLRSPQTHAQADAVARWRFAFVFVFGLIHGLGFAGALKEVITSGASLALDLVGFNLGIEMAQLLVCGLFLFAATRISAEWRSLVTRWGSAALVFCGLLWALTRLVKP